MGLNILCVGIGGCIGAIFRYVTSIFISKVPGILIPLSTLLVNILGGFLIGVIMEISITQGMNPRFKTFLTTGVMGGLTTFSTFSYETISLFSSSNYIAGFLNVFLNVTLSLLGVLLGKFLVRSLLA